MAGDTESRLLCGVIQSAVADHRPDSAEWKGSDLPDTYLACLSAYADVTYVDKRTYEALRQARPKLPKLAAIVRRVEKAADYGTVARHLADRSNSAASES